MYMYFSSTHWLKNVYFHNFMVYIMDWAKSYEVIFGPMFVFFILYSAFTDNTACPFSHSSYVSTFNGRTSRYLLLFQSFWIRLCPFLLCVFRVTSPIPKIWFFINRSLRVKVSRQATVGYTYSRWPFSDHLCLAGCIGQLSDSLRVPWSVSESHYVGKYHSRSCHQFWYTSWYQC